LASLRRLFLDYASFKVKFSFDFRATLVFFLRSISV